MTGEYFVNTCLFIEVASAGIGFRHTDEHHWGGVEAFEVFATPSEGDMTECHAIDVNKLDVNVIFFFVKQYITARIVLMIDVLLVHTSRECAYGIQHFPFIYATFINVVVFETEGGFLIYEVAFEEYETFPRVNVANRIRDSDTFLLEFEGVFVRASSFGRTKKSVYQSIDEDGKLEGFYNHFA